MSPFTRRRSAARPLFFVVALVVSFCAGAAALSAAGVPHLVQVDGTMFSVFFTPDDSVTAVRDFADASAQRTDRFAAFFYAMLDQGAHLPPSAFEAWFLSSAHDDVAVDRVLAALRNQFGGHAVERNAGN